MSSNADIITGVRTTKFDEFILYHKGNFSLQFSRISHFSVSGVKCYCADLD